MKSALSGKKILVVDDEVDLREIISEDLELMGAQVFSAENGTLAFELALKIKPDVIVSDIRMPGGDGIELLKKIRAIPSLREPFVFLITGYSDISFEEAERLGATSVLAKPFYLDQLRDLVVTQLSGLEQRAVSKV